MIQASKIIGTGLATTGLIGAGVLIGALIIGVARNPSLRGQLFSYTTLGFAFAKFAFAKATGLFALMMGFLLISVVSISIGVVFGMDFSEVVNIFSKMEPKLIIEVITDIEIKVGRPLKGPGVETIISTGKAPTSGSAPVLAPKPRI